MSSEQSKESSLQSSEPSPQEEQQKPKVDSEVTKIPLSLRDIGPLQGESSSEPQTSSLTPQDPEPVPQASQKTQGVRPPRNDGAQALQDAAKKAAQSNSRSDVHEYMRIRRNFV